ncbi:MAG: hypothetical protein QG646_2405 [Euryarchaeota archaeon]|nr:hypothetical protein [Euryarchaeota archaeon]
MFKKSKIGKILITMFLLTPMLFIYLLPFSSAIEDNKQLNHSEYNEISDSSIKELTNNSLFIAYRGTLPETINIKWENSIVNCWLNLTLEGPSYSKFDKSIESVATNNKVIIIYLGSAYKEEINDSRVDEIYKKIDDYCKQQEGISEVPVIFMWAQDEENLPLPDYGPKAVEEAMKQLSGFITTRGTMPEIHHEEEKREWINSLIEYSRSSSFPTELNPYLASSGGPVNMFGADINGYLIVGFNSSTPEKVNESVIDEIYQVIDKHFETKGISNVPVVFAFVNTTLTDSAPADRPDVNKNNDTNLSANKEKIVGNETNNQISGFTSIMFVLGLLSLLIIKRL